MTLVASVVVIFPATFTWELRSTPLQDTYTFEVYWPGDTYRMPWFSAFVGDAGSYTWASLHDDFEYGQEYAWNMRLLWPDGSFVGGYAGQPVIFSP